MHCGGGSFKSQFKKADKSGAQLALILGENELAQQTISIKPLRQDKEQIQAGWSDIVETLRGQLQR
ncbi:MAG: His/Gly/Thr/Pro-type tRNA ligase C-terminal domain-containing protein, partial [Gammaproteobacteria bacterium]